MDAEKFRAAIEQDLRIGPSQTAWTVAELFVEKGIADPEHLTRACNQVRELWLEGDSGQATETEQPIPWALPDRVNSALLVEKLKPWVTYVRMQAFGSPEPPFRSVREARDWIQIALGAAWDDDPAIVYEEFIRGAVNEVSAATGLSRAAIGDHLLAGIEPTVEPVRVGYAKTDLPGNESVETLHIQLHRPLTASEVRQLDRLLRGAWNEAAGTTESAYGQMLRRVVMDVLGEDVEKGYLSRENWERVAAEYANRTGEVKRWGTLKMKYYRMCRVR